MVHYYIDVPQPYISQRCSTLPLLFTLRIILTVPDDYLKFLLLEIRKILAFFYLLKCIIPRTTNIASFQQHFASTHYLLS
jgi:hypothetical protein